MQSESPLRKPNSSNVTPSTWVSASRRSSGEPGNSTHDPFACSKACCSSGLAGVPGVPCSQAEKPATVSRIALPSGVPNASAARTAAAAASTNTGRRRERRVRRSSSSQSPPSKLAGAYSSSARAMAGENSISLMI